MPPGFSGVGRVKPTKTRKQRAMLTPTTGERRHNGWNENDYLLQGRTETIVCLTEACLFTPITQRIASSSVVAT